MIDLRYGPDKFVAFVGAGASALSPSGLPTWNQFNDLLLESLCESLDNFSGRRQPTRDILQAFRTRRDESHYFAPDFQAQLMEEEVGADYFRVWKALETDLFSPVHRDLAQLASMGRLAAIVTTNFDCLLERALDTKGVPYLSIYDRHAFDDFISSGAPGEPLPVIKIHGSIEDTSSLVDTLRQRVAGTPHSLNRILDALLRNYPWLYLGFSGADFSYNPRYLGILDAAPEAKGFLFLAREGVEAQRGVREMANAYGPQKASIIHGDLSKWLPDNFDLPAQTEVLHPLALPDPGRFSAIKLEIHKWTANLGAMSIVNILHSMLRSAGMDAEALWLMRKTWKSYREESDLKNKSYSRYNYNYGLSLLGAGFIENQVALTEDRSNFFEWKDGADQNAYEFLWRSYHATSFLPAAAHLASVLAYRGDVKKGLSVLAMVGDTVIAGEKNLDTCDVAIGGIGVADVIRLFDPMSEHLKLCLELTKQFGDEQRRAVLSAHLGRFLTYGGRFEEATQYLDEADKIGQRLGIKSVLLLSKSARGRWFSDSGTSDATAITLLSEVAHEIREMDRIPLFYRVDILAGATQVPVMGHHPLLCRVLLDLNRAARFGNDTDTMNQTLDQLDEIATQVFPGYAPHYYLAYVECLLSYGSADSTDLIADLIRRARAMGIAGGNPWVADAATHLESHLSQ